MEASVATPGQGAPPAGTAPAGSQGDAGQGQSTAAGKGDAGFNWGMFPDVPAEHRELVEPHLRNAQGHVTRVEQQYAPYKGLMDTVDPSQVENLVGFLQTYQSNPAETVMGLVQQLQQDGVLTPQQLAQLAGTQPQEAAAQQQQEQPGQEEMPEWARQMQARLDQQDQREQQAQQAQQEAEMAQTLETAKTNIRGQLTQGGIGEDLVSDDQIVAFIIANDGDEQAAAAAIAGMRQSFLADFTNQNTGGRQEPAVNGELPKPAKQSGRRDPDGMGDAKVKAEQFLRQQNAANASG